MDRMIAFCGLVCTECPAYQATQANDLAALERVAAQWREQYDAPNITAAYATCDGCVAANGRLGGHCLECEIRACGVKRGIANCAACPDYGCEKLIRFFAMVPPARATLEEVRRAR
jgi:hypothetical protein